MTNPRKIFVSIGGQHDNIGDTILRRHYLDTLRTVGELHVQVGQERGFIAGLRLQASDVTYASRSAWQWMLIKDLLSSGRVYIAFNAGETQIERFRLNTVWGLLLLNRLLGGENLLCGVGIRDFDRGQLNRWQKAALRCHLSAFTLTAWRDAKSHEWSGGAGSVVPDWAFGEGENAAAIAGARRYLAVSMRGDRPLPEASWLESISTLARESGLTLLTIAQVMRDEARARELSQALRCRHLPWDDPAGNLALREEVVRRVYRECAGLVSDRVHALIVGLTEGAAPICFATTSAEKGERTLAVAGIHGVSFSPATHSPGELAAAGRDILARRSEFVHRSAEARERLRQFEGQICRVLSRAISEAPAETSLP